MLVLAIVENLSLPVNWLLFALSFVLLVGSATFLPYFLISLIRQGNGNVTFISFFLLSLITSLPELLIVLFFPIVNETSGVMKSFAVILSSNLITGVAFCVLSIFYFAIFSRLKVTGLIKLSCVAVLILNLFFFLVGLYPHSFLNGRVAHWSLFGLFFVIAYFIFLIYSSGKSKEGGNSFTLEFKRVPFKSNPFALSLGIVVLITVLVSVILFLIGLTNHLQQQYQLSDGTVGGFFFALATTSPEIGTAFSLYQLGFGLAAGGVIIGSHLFNGILLFLTDFVTDFDLFSVLSKHQFSDQLLELNLASLFLTILLCLVSAKIFRRRKGHYLLIVSAFVSISLLTLLKIG